MQTAVVLFGQGRLEAVANTACKEESVALRDKHAGVCVCVCVCSFVL